MSLEPRIKTIRSECTICGNRKLLPLIDLPQFPLTGIFLKSGEENRRFAGIDQAFLFCENCGHGQLLNVVAPSFLYDGSYTHRSSSSPLATRGNDFFISFLKRVSGGKKFRTILEVGCNDLYLLHQLVDNAEMLVGIDPIWRESTPTLPPKISVIGKFLEEIHLPNEIKNSPDLVISAHTFEHLENPRESLSRLADFAQDGALFVIEVPGFDTLLRNGRFDQIFHQHLQYFSLSSLEYLIEGIGCRYLDHCFNYEYWGGTLLIAFEKGNRASKNKQKRFAIPQISHIQNRFHRFTQHLNGVAKTLEDLAGETLYGYGAAQMLPTLAYHMKSDLSFLEAILDDDVRRHQCRYPFLPISIRTPEKDLNLEKANVFVTAPDSARPILNKLISMKTKRILLPFSVL